METEKITINIGAIDLGHIDLLVEQSFYSNRTDFIRTAIRNQLATHSEELSSIKSTGILGLDIIENQTNQIGKDINNTIKSVTTDTKFSGTGVFIYSKEALEDIKASGRRIELSMLGMLVIEKDVPAELVKETFKKVKVYGIIRANDAIKKILAELG